MTIPEAAQLVIQAGALANWGAVFVLDIGEPIKIGDLAERIIRLSCLIPVSGGSGDLSQGHISIKYIGLRPGEKLHEETSYTSSFKTTSYPRIFVTQKTKPSKVVFEIFAAVERSINESDLGKIRRAILEISLAWLQN